MPEPPTPSTRNPQAFGQHLIEVHDLFRTGLAELRKAAEEADGGPSTSTSDSTGLAGDLRQHCLYFCHALHGHHTREDRGIFPQLRAAVPELAPVLDRLQDEHRSVARSIEQIEQVAESLPRAGAETAPRLRAELDRLSEALLTHLAYEEEQLVPLLDAMS